MLAVWKKTVRVVSERSRRPCKKVRNGQRQWVLIDPRRKTKTKGLRNVVGIGGGGYPLVAVASYNANG